MKFCKPREQRLQFVQWDGTPESFKEIERLVGLGNVRPAEGTDPESLWCKPHHIIPSGYYVVDCGYGQGYEIIHEVIFKRRFEEVLPIG